MTTEVYLQGLDNKVKPVGAIQRGSGHFELNGHTFTIFENEENSAVYYDTHTLLARHTGGFITPVEGGIIQNTSGTVILFDKKETGQRALVSYTKGIT